jgi:solute carrier family 25 iron transporter 28/37
MQTHMQASSATRGSKAGATPGAIATAREIVRTRGLAGLFRGVSAVVAGAAPAHAVSFTVYEAAKRLLGGWGFPGMAVSGVLATLAHDAVLAPLDALKQRMQLGARPYTGLWHCARVVWRREGLRGLYAGYTAALAMNVPYAAIYFSSYEALRARARRALGDGALAHLLAGAGAGAAAGACTTPLDVARTRLQTQGDAPPGEGTAAYRGLLDALARVWTREGPTALLRGLAPRLLFQSTSAAIMWTTYESAKRLLGG